MINLYRQDSYWNYRYSNEDVVMGGFQFSFDEEKVKIWSVEIKPEYCGKGYGQAMMKEAIQEAVRIANEKHLKKLWLYVFKNNHNALHIYKKFGFVVDKEDGGQYEMVFDVASYGIVTVTSTPAQVSWCIKCNTYTTQTILNNGNGMCWCGTENDKSQALFEVILNEIS